jgi:hypothetical protein
LIANFLHYFDLPTCETLLRKVHAALKPGGAAAMLEFVPNEDRVSPPIPVRFNLTALGGIPMEMPSHLLNLKAWCAWRATVRLS